MSLSLTMNRKEGCVLENASWSIGYELQLTKLTWKILRAHFDLDLVKTARWGMGETLELAFTVIFLI